MNDTAASPMSRRTPGSTRSALAAYPYYWRVRKWLPLMYGKRCRMVARGTMNAGLFEFKCGYRVVASRNSIRRVKADAA